MQILPPLSLFDLDDARPRAAEFFAGIGLVRIGLERAGFHVSWSNDIDADKHDMYTKHFGESDGVTHSFVLDDIAAVSVDDIPSVDLAWASFPCTDLSLAGNRSGLDGRHSGTFWNFIDIIKTMEDRKPAVITLENVSGFATSRSGADIESAVKALNDLGYSVDVLAIDALRFVPQSRPRMFLVAVREDIAPDDDSTAHSLRPAWLEQLYENSNLIMHKAPLPVAPERHLTELKSIVETVRGDDPRWWDGKRTKAFLDSLSHKQLERLSELKKRRKDVYRTAYRRTRGGIPRWEIRSDDVAGCLRTARGGSSKQALVRIANGGVKVRWMTSLEYARLMGAGEYNLSGLRDNQALFGFGDAVVVDVVAWLATYYLIPAVRGYREQNEASGVSEIGAVKVLTDV